MPEQDTQQNSQTNTQQPMQPLPVQPSKVLGVNDPPGNLGNATINTTSVESKIGLYTKITYASLWFLVIALSTFVSALLTVSIEGSLIVFLISLAIIATPIFVIANGKRSKELQENPILVDDIFLKKHVRSNLYTSVVLTAIAGFIFVYQILSTLFLSQESSDGKSIISSLVWTLGFSIVLWFSWAQHAKTSK